MNFSDDELLEKVPQGNTRAVARLITRIETCDGAARAVAAKLRRPSGRGHVVGVTGAPGAGKSTLVDQMTRAYRSRGKSVAIVAVDPSSPFSGGAILGDRIRMNHASEDPSVFIRSMATRGSLGGLSRATLETVHVLDSAGFDLIIVETVGVGQAEVDIVRTADTCLVVLVPGMGDSVQIIKAGLIEIADLFVINKADRDGALSLEKDLLTLLSLSDFEADAWKPPILKTVAVSGQGAEELVEASERHSVWLETSTGGRARRHMVVTQMLLSLAGERIAQRELVGARERAEQLAHECVGRKLTPLEAIDALVAFTNERN